MMPAPAAEPTTFAHPPSSRFHRALAAGSFLCLISFVASGVAAWQGGASTWVSLASSALPAAWATLIFVPILLLVPSLTEADGYTFPQNFTLPAIFMALLLMVRSFMTSTPSGLVAFGDHARFDSLWNSPPFLITVFVLQVVLLSASQALRPKSS